MYEARESAWTIKIVSLEQVQSQDTLFDNQGSPGRQGKRLVKLVSAVASFPELRLEGCNGITESGARGAESEISIIPESEFNGALEMEKLRRLDFSPSLRGLL